MHAQALGPEPPCLPLTSTGEPAMPVVTTSDLYSAQSFRDLVLAPLLQTSVVLRALTRIDTTASVAHIPRVSGGNVGFVAEAAEIPDAGLGADLLEVIPRKLAGLAFTSRESSLDAASSSILGEALARKLAAATDRSFFAAGGGVAAVGLAGVAGVGEVDAAPGIGLDAYAQGIGNLVGACARGSEGRPPVYLRRPEPRLRLRPGLPPPQRATG